MPFRSGSQAAPPQCGESRDLGVTVNCESSLQVDRELACGDTVPAQDSLVFSTPPSGLTSGALSASPACGCAGGAGYF